MVFKDKLSFIMGLTETKNRQLANAIMVDPSLISRLRSGKRNLPNNAEYISSICECLSTRLITAFQRDTLTRAIGKSYIDFSDKENTARIIESWLLSENPTVESYGNMLLKSFDKAALSFSEEFAEENFLFSTNLNDNKQTIYTFYGDDGKQQAALLFFQMILSAKETLEIKLANGSNTEWLWKDRKFSKQVSNSIKKAILKGHTIKRIVPGDLNITMSLDTVERWLPLYSTGRVHSYYYPYHRDNIYSRTLYVVPGVAAFVSTSVGNKVDSGLTILTTNPDMISSFESEIDEYLNLCLSTTSFYNYDKSGEELYRCVSNFYSYQAECINIVGGLSYITTPKDELLNFAQRTDNIDTLALIQHFEHEYANIERLLHRYRYTEIFYMDSFEDIISGKAKSSAINGEAFIYTPNAYKKHLKNIITMLEQHENYHVVLLNERTIESSIYIKNGYAVLAFSYKEPYSVCETKNLSMVNAVWEYAKSEIDQGVSDEINKMQVMMKINKLLLQLEDYVWLSREK